MIVDYVRQREWRVLAVTIAVFFALAYLTTKLSWTGQGPASLRLAGAVLLGILIRRRIRQPWLAYYLVFGWLAWIAASVLAGRDLELSVAFGAVRIFEIWLAYWLVSRLALPQITTRALADYAKLFVIAIVVAPLFGALASVTASEYLHDATPVETAMNWFTGNAVGMLVVLPAVLAWDPNRPWQIVLRGSNWTGVAAWALTAAITIVALRTSDNAFIVISLPLLVAAFGLNRIGFSFSALIAVMVVVVFHKFFLPFAAGLNATDGDPLSFQEAMFYSLCAVFPATLVSITEKIRAGVAMRLADVAHQLQMVTDNVPALIGYVDDQRRYRFANMAYEQLFGRSKAEIIGLHQVDLLGASATTALLRPLKLALAGERQSFEAHIGGRDMEVTYVPDRANDNTAGVFVLGMDITERKRSARQLFEEKERAQITLSSIGDAVVACDTNLCITAFNPTAQLLSGFSEGEALGRPFDEVIKLVDLESGAPSLSPVAVAVAHNRVIGLQSDTAIERRDGLRIPVEDSAAPIRDSAGAVIGAVMVFHDVSESRAMAQKMSHMAQHDLLTDLPNRVLLLDRLSQALTTIERGGCGALLFLDIDHFKHINDSLGHGAGDIVLRQIGCALIDALREDDTVSRQGGDEFVVLLPRLTDPRDAARVAEKVMAAIQVPISVMEHTVHVSASIGIALFPQDAQDAEALIKQADIALFHSKRAGRKRFTYFTAEMGSRAEERMRLERDLRLALEADEFFLVYQPKVRLPAGSICGMEALVRWRRKDGTIVPPGEFIPAAEDSGLILALDEWVVREATRQLGTWQEAGLSIVPISVNLSLARIDLERLVRNLGDALAEAGIAPGLLEVEFTESQTFSSSEDARVTIEQLKKLGVRVAMDDFGTGYSSFSYLTEYAFDTLKIDRTFVMGLSENPKSHAIVEAILCMGRALDCEMIAEGVENSAQADVLQRLGCSDMQGFFFSRPVSADAMETLLKEGIPYPVNASWDG